MAVRKLRQETYLEAEQENQNFVESWNYLILIRY